MLFMLSKLGLRLFHRRHSIDGLPNIKIPVSNQNTAALSQQLPPIHDLQPQKSLGGSVCTLDFLEALRSGVSECTMASCTEAPDRPQLLRRCMV